MPAASSSHRPVAAITFEAHHIQPGETGWMISGTLAVKDTHCPVRLQVTGPATPARADHVDLHATGRIDRRPAGVTAGPARHGKATPVRLHTHELAAAKPGSLSHLGAPGLQPPDQSAQRRRR